MNPRYEDVINKQRTDEGKIADFEASSRKWGQNIGNGIVENNGKLYVSFIPKEHILNTYMLDDKILDKTDLDKFIPVKKESNSQDINNAVLFRTISLENICTIEVL